MAANIPRPEGRRPTGGGEAAVGCWGGCWYGGCWGGCWPGVQADPEIVEAVSRSLGSVENTPEDLSRLFSSLGEAAAKRKG
jgi:hypothetical protein